MREKLTVLIPCKNERKNIRLCIESLQGLADEILIADSGSTDGTLEIIREIGGCRVIEREYVSQADFLNWAMPQATHAWVLIVDADERVTERLAQDIRRVLENPPEHLDGYWVSFKCFFMGHPLTFARFNTPAVRLVRRDRCRYAACRVHAEIAIPKQRAGRLKGKLLHYSYWSYDAYLRKYTQYTKLVAQDRWERGKRVTLRGLLMRPMLRFFFLYVIRLGFLDGLPGLQVCMLTAFCNTFLKQCWLWEMEHALPQPDPEAEMILPFSGRQAGGSVRTDGRVARRA
jgi:glycosyltransferase involved in cell wall biosynthesis